MLKNGIIWIVGLVIALTAGLSAMGAIAKNKAPALALSIFPENGYAAEALAAASIRATVATNNGLFPENVKPSEKSWAKKAFMAEPVTPQAVTILALGKGGVTERQLMRMAFTLSRRQSLTIGWLIVDSGKRGDVSEVLAHYDTLLRTSSSAEPVVVKLMADALEDEEFVQPFVDLLSKRPVWANRFWNQVVRTDRALVNAATLKIALRKLGVPDIYNDRDLVRALVKKNQFVLAEQLYESLSPPRSVEQSSDRDKLRFVSDYSPIDWQLISQGQYGAAIVNDSLFLSAARNSGGLFARKLITLSQGTFNLKVTTSERIATGARLSINLTCAEKTKIGWERVNVDFSKSAVTEQSFETSPDCRYYWLSLTGRSSNQYDGLDLTIKSIVIDQQ